jgi:hypothetical protein
MISVGEVLVLNSNWETDYFQTSFSVFLIFSRHTLYSLLFITILSGDITEFELLMTLNERVQLGIRISVVIC